MTALANVHIRATGLAGRVRSTELILGPALDWTEMARCAQDDQALRFPGAGLPHQAANAICAPSVVGGWGRT